LHDIGDKGGSWDAIVGQIVDGVPPLSEDFETLSCLRHLQVGISAFQLVVITQRETGESENNVRFGLYFADYVGRLRRALLGCDAGREFTAPGETKAYDKVSNAAGIIRFTARHRRSFGANQVGYIPI
jgi:hypothetical protein